jgi:hypothetical protein
VEGITASGRERFMKAAREEMILEMEVTAVSESYPRLREDPREKVTAGKVSDHHISNLKIILFLREIYHNLFSSIKDRASTSLLSEPTLALKYHVHFAIQVFTTADTHAHGRIFQMQINAPTT